MRLRIGDFEAAGAGPDEPDAFAAGAGDLDDAVANFDDAAIRDAGTDIDQASGAARERAGVDDGAAYDRAAAGERGERRVRGDRGHPAQEERAGSASAPLTTSVPPLA